MRSTRAHDYARRLLIGAPILSVAALAEELHSKHPEVVRLIARYERAEARRTYLRANQHGDDYEVLRERIVSGERVCTILCNKCGFRATEKKWRSRPCIRTESPAPATHRPASSRRRPKSGRS